MERRMEKIEVFVNDSGTITIMQRDDGYDPAIAIHPEQVPVLIKWLNECIEECKRSEAIDQSFA